MNLLGESEPSLLREGARRALGDHAPHARLIASPDAAAAMAATHWEMAGSLGWNALLLEEADDGLGLGCTELVELCEEMGAGLFCGPWLATAVLSPCLVRAARRLGVAWQAPGARDAVALALPVVDHDGNVRYLGEHPALATHYVFVDQAEDRRLRFRLRESAGMEVIARPTALDPACPVVLLARPPDDAGPAIDTAIEDDDLLPFHLAIAAEMTGVAAAAIERSIDWVSERRQFDRPVGSFQAVKHRLSDAYVSFSKALHLTRAAAVSGDTAAAIRARVIASAAATTACRGLVQHLGGAGISWEMDAHLYLKRALRLCAVPPAAATLRRIDTDAYIASVVAARGAR